MNKQPPQFILRFLKWFCPDHLYEEIEGDLIQRFNGDLLHKDHRTARRRFIWNAIRFFRPGIVFRNRFSIGLIDLTMLSSYLKIALRVLNRNRSYSAINIAGLAFGITGALLLFLWISHEFSVDQFHVNKDRIYTAWNREKKDGQWNSWSTTPRILAPTLKKEFAGVESAVSYAQYSDSYLFRAGDVKIQKDEVFFAEADFLTMFSFPLIKGEVRTAMSDPTSIVLTERFARQLFGDKEPFGETVTVSLSGMDFPFTVTGILRDLPANTDFNFEFLIPWLFLESLEGAEENWLNNSVLTLVMLQEGADVHLINEQIRAIKKKHTAGADDTEVFLYEFAKNHLYSRFENGIPSGGRIDVLRMLGVLGLCLVGIACINFINLSTARARRRAKEVAVRKVTGAYRRTLVIQFLLESVLIAWVAGLVALVAVYLALPFFNILVEQDLQLDLNNGNLWILVFCGVTTVGILAGSYPAIYLSSFRPAAILKGPGIMGSRRSYLRTTLVVFQFGFAITMIVSTIIVRNQVMFVQARDPGYVKDHLVYQYLTGELKKNFEGYRNDLLQQGIAQSITQTSSPITQRLSNSSGIRWRGKDPDNKTSIERFYVDQNITATVGLVLAEGRDFDLKRFPGDSTAMMLNETAVRLMEFDEPVGEIVFDNGQEWHVIGVVKDFILTSPYQNVEPMVLAGSKHTWAFNVVHIRLNSGRSTQESIAAMSKIFAKYNPDYPFEYHFVDVEYARKFSDMEKTLTLTTVFTSVAIFIACLGLLGLSAYIAESRVKEIGIRKVLGGSVLSITRLLSGNALKPIFIAIVLFTPLGWLGVDWWLNSFTYRVSIPVWVFPMAGTLIILIAWVTISVQTIRAANTDPVNTLRNE